MQGNHPGSFEVSHALAWSGSKPSTHRKLDERYDRVIAGAAAPQQIGTGQELGEQSLDC